MAFDFNIDENKLAEIAATMAGHTTANLADFTGYDASLDGTWLTSWKTQIETANFTLDDETYLDESEEKRVLVEKAKTICLDYQRDLKYYAEKAWGTDDARFRAFRFVKMHSIGNSVPRFVTYCHVNYRLATKHAADLLAQTMPAGLLALFLAAINDLANKDIEHELYFQERTIAAAGRNAIYNKVFEFMRRANSAADNIYRNNPEKLKLFNLPAPPKKKKEETTPTVTPDV